MPEKIHNIREQKALTYLLSELFACVNVYFREIPELLFTPHISVE